MATANSLTAEQITWQSVIDLGSLESRYNSLADGLCSIQRSEPHQSDELCRRGYVAAVWVGQLGNGWAANGVRAETHF